MGTFYRLLHAGIYHSIEDVEAIEGFVSSASNPFPLTSRMMQRSCLLEGGRVWRSLPLQTLLFHCSSI